VNGKDYHFVSRGEFLKKRKKKKLLEWASNFGYFYGTPLAPVKDSIKKGKNILLTIDVKGAKKVKKLIPDSIHIFLMPPSISDLKKRLKKRGTDKQKDIKKRLSIAAKEIKEAKKYDYTVVNDNINNAVSRLKSIVRLETKKAGGE